MGDAIVRTLAPPVLDAPAAARMGHGGASQSRALPGPRRRLSAHGGRADPRRRGRAGSRLVGRAPGRCRAVAPALGPLAAVARWVSLPPRLTPSQRPSARTRGPPLTARRTWRFFEVFVGPGDTCSCRRTTCRRTRSRSSPTARRRPILACICCRLAARDFGWLGTRTSSIGSTLRSRRWDARAIPGTFLQLVRDERPPPARSPDMFPPSTAGTWPATARPRQRLSGTDRPPAARSRALRGNRGCASCSCARPRAPSRTTGAPKPSRADLDDALRGTGRRASRRPGRAATGRRASAARRRADTLVDIARTLTGNGARARLEVLVWAEATRAGIASHGRDLDADALGKPSRGRRRRRSRPHVPRGAIASTRPFDVLVSDPGRAGRPCESRGRRAHRSCAMRGRTSGRHGG